MEFLEQNFLSSVTVIACLYFMSKVQQVYLLTAHTVRIWNLTRVGVLSKLWQYLTMPCSIGSSSNKHLGSGLINGIYSSTHLGSGHVHNSLGKGNFPLSGHRSQASWEISFQLLLVRHAENTFVRLSHLTWLLSMWRSRGTTMKLSGLIELFTLFVICEQLHPRAEDGSRKSTDVILRTPKQTP